MMYAFLAGKHRKSPRLLELAREQSKNLKTIVTLTVDFVKGLTYQAKHRHQINWDGTMHESQQLLWAVITGLMLAYFLFAGMTM